jgi:hypothetical protein
MTPFFLITYFFNLTFIVAPQDLIAFGEQLSFFSLKSYELWECDLNKNIHFYAIKSMNA